MSCGSCSMCCKLLDVPEVKTGTNWCPNCKPGQGCSVYTDRPEPCRTFECIWLQSQSHPEAKMAEALRPDRCKGVMVVGTDGITPIIHIDPAFPDAHKKGDLALMIGNIQAKGQRVIIVCGTRRTILLVPGETRPEGGFVEAFR